MYPFDYFSILPCATLYPPDSGFFEIGHRDAGRRTNRECLSIISNRNHFIRNIEAGEHLELFLVWAVTAILSIRLFLRLTNYPQIAPGSFHIAHMLWGGLFMMAAILILLLFLRRSAERWAATIGGIGFGTFIDEIGKFVTQDNNYFYEPSVALIYITFVVIVIFVRAIGLRGNYSEREYLVNAIKKTEEIALDDLDPDEKRRALQYLKQSGESPMVQALTRLLHEAETVPPGRPDFWTRGKQTGNAIYARMVDLPGFNSIIIAFFCFQMLVKFSELFVLIFLRGFKFENLSRIRVLQGISLSMNHFSYIEWAELSSSFISAFFVFWGFWELQRSRFLAYKMFERSILITIFITQVLVFYQNQFGALLGLFFNMLILFLLRYMIGKERATP